MERETITSDMRNTGSNSFYNMGSHPILTGDVVVAKE
jgi:hypothetical protein